jgi:hypothetical protein
MTPRLCGAQNLRRAFEVWSRAAVLAQEPEER